MSTNVSNKTKMFLIKALLVLEGVWVLFALFTFAQDALFSIQLKKEGQQTVATVIRKDNGQAYYDILYQDVYYKGSIHLTKSAFRRIQVGERFQAVILPDKLEYYKEGLITPFSIILQPLPYYEQDIEGERRRILSMYGESIVR